MRGKCRYGDGCNSDRRRLNRPYGGHIELIRFKEWDDQGARARSDTAILRKVVGRNLHARQFRKVIWDIINTLFLTMQLSNLLLMLSFSIRKLTSMASRDRGVLSNFLKNSELKTTHNTFGDCRAHFSRQPFSK